MRITLLAFLFMPSLAVMAQSNGHAMLQTPKRSSELFQMEKVWPVHLTLTEEQWAAMEPKRAPQQSGMFGGPPGGPGGFGPGMILGPVVLHEADADGDKKITSSEMVNLAERWFGAWDTEGKGKLTADAVKAGLNRVFAAMPPPPAAQQGGGMNLQGKDGGRNGLAAMMGLTPEYVEAELDFGNTHFPNVAVRIKGNGTLMQSLTSSKRSLKVDLNKHVKGEKLANVSVLNLHNCVTDGGWMNEVLSYAAFRDAGVPASRTAYAAVSVTVPGKYDHEYLGLYSLVENPDTSFAEELFGTKKGAIFKPVTPQPFTDLGDKWDKYQQTYDPKTELEKKQKQRVIEFCKLVSHADDTEFAAKVGEYLDVEEFARFMAVTVWLATLDSILGPGQNYYVYLHPKTQKFQFLPWDLDHSFGQFFLIGNGEEREKLSIEKPWMGDKRLLERVFAQPEFQRLYRARLAECTEEFLRPERIQKQVDDLAAAIHPWIEKEPGEKLQRFDKIVAGEVVPLNFGPPPGVNRGAGGTPPPGAGGERGPGPGAGGGPGGPFGFMAPPKPIKSFVVARAQSVADQLAGKEAGRVLGMGGPGAGGRPGEFGPGNFLRRPLLAALDADKDEVLSKEEMVGGFAKWFAEWGGEEKGGLSEEQLRAGFNKTLQQPPRPPQ